MPPTQTLLPVEGEHVAVTVLKQSHIGEHLILRLYETRGEAGLLSLSEPTTHGIVAAWKSNILEEKAEALDALTLVPVGPWEILTLRLKLAPRYGSLVIGEWKNAGK